MTMGDALHLDLSSFEEKLNLRTRHARVSTEILRAVGIMVVVTAMSMGLDNLGFTEASVVITYVLGVLVIALVTSRRIYCLVASILSVVAFNFFFTTPRYSLLVWGPEYPGTFLVMFVVGLLASTLAMRLREQAEAAQEASRRLQVLLSTDQLLSDCGDAEQIVKVIGSQLEALLKKDVVWYSVEGNGLGPSRLISPGSGSALADEPSIARRALVNLSPAGAGSSSFSAAQGFYLPVHTSNETFGVVGIMSCGEALDEEEQATCLSVVGEAAIALERERAVREREEAAVLAKNEQLRANLLRSISHDLRTPLTAISGNADILLTAPESLSEESKTKLITDIYDDAQWLNGTVENLLTVTKLEDGNVRLTLTCEVVDDIIDEALRHVSADASRHEITVKHSDDLLLARMDVHLIVQVIVNLVNNAISHTPAGSHITISDRREDDFVSISVSDDGPGVPETEKDRIFDLFYTTGGSLSDSNKGVGLGLALCRAVVEAHGGIITVDDKAPHGAVFRFTLPAEEVPTDGE